jgi:transposase-like protein
MIIFSLVELMDVQKCYDYLCTMLHPEGLSCPKCQCSVQDSKIHRKDRAPILIYECKNGHFYNLFTKTVWQGTHHTCPTIIRILQGITQGASTLHLSQELVVDRKHLLERRHKLQNFADKASIRTPLADQVTEVDEMYQNAGEKGVKHSDPNDPPRCRGNKTRGHGTWDTDRPPVLGIIGRESGQVQLEVKHNSARKDLEPTVLKATQPGATVNTDEWGAYNHLAKADRLHVTVCHTPGKRVWARDDDGDGIREAHVNTSEGFWTGLRNFLRPFRGVNKVYLQQYVAIHEWAHNIKRCSMDFLRILCGVTQFAP